MDSFVEVQNWGLNALTISALVTVVVSLIQGSGIIQQGRKIWETKSTQSLSTIMLFYSMAYFLVFMVYGLAKFSLAMVFNGMIGFLFLPSLLGVFKFGRPSRQQIIALVFFALLIPAMAVIKEKDIFLSILGVGVLISILLQLREMFIQKSRGAIDVRFLAKFLFANLVWLVYGVLVHNWVLIYFNILGAGLFFTGIMIYYEYPFHLVEKKDG